MDNESKTKLAKALLQLEADDLSDVLFKLGGGALFASNAKEMSLRPSGEMGELGKVKIDFEARIIDEDCSTDHEQSDDGYYNRDHLPEHDDEVETVHADRKPEDTDVEEKLEEILDE